MRTLSFLFIFSMLFLTAASAYDFSTDNICYNIVPGSSNAVYVTSGINYTGAVVVPQTVTNNGITYTVESIGDNAFYKCYQITSMQIPATIKSIGNNAFSACSGIRSLVLPEALQTIGQYAFNGCTNIATMTIPSSVTSIGNYAFYNCSSQLEVHIPASVTSIGTAAFFNAGTSYIVAAENPNYSGLDGILYDKQKTILYQCPTPKGGRLTLPETVTTIASYAFADCVWLDELILPNSLTTIADNAFVIRLYSETNLLQLFIPSSVNSIGTAAFQGRNTGIRVHADNPVYADFQGLLMNKDQSTLIYCPISKEGSFEIPASVTRISDNAFYFCYKLTNIIIPASVTSIGSNAFYYCNGLQTLQSNAPIPVNLTASFSVFLMVNKSTCILYVPIGSKALYQEANQWKDFLNIQEKATGFNAIIDQQDFILPNPVINDFQIKGVNRNSVLQISDVKGKVLFNKEVTEGENVSVVHFTTGVYLVSVKLPDGRIIKSKMLKL